MIKFFKYLRVHTLSNNCWKPCAACTYTSTHPYVLITYTYTQASTRHIIPEHTHHVYIRIGTVTHRRTLARTLTRACTQIKHTSNIHTTMRTHIHTHVHVRNSTFMSVTSLFRLHHLSSRHSRPCVDQGYSAPPMFPAQ
jgi:hypothetical protein